MAINNAIIVGRAGKDPEMRYFENGKVKTTFSIAVSRWNKGEETTDWFNIELWDKAAEVAGEYVKKGRMVAVIGKIAISEWTDKEGHKRTRPYINAHEIKLLGGKKEE